MAALPPRAQGSGRVITQTITLLTTTYTALVTFGDSRTATLTAAAATTAAPGLAPTTSAAGDLATAAASAYPTTNFSSPQVALIAILGIIGSLALVGFCACLCLTRDWYFYQPCCCYRSSSSGGGGGSSSSSSAPDIDTNPDPLEYTDEGYGVYGRRIPQPDWLPERVPQPDKRSAWVEMATGHKLEPAPFRAPPERDTFYYQASSPQTLGGNGRGW